jgi:AcrR family transcriptional regulator
MSEAHKQDILHAAIAEFGRAGYAAASTNEIVRHAKVSKGLLFHYFTNKENLYTACQAFVLEQYGRFMAGRMRFESADFFDRILQALRVKMEFGCQQPEFLAFINRAWHIENENPMQRPDAEALVMQAMQPQSMLALFEGVDTSRFREGMDMQKTMYYIRLAMEACWLQYTAACENSPEKMVQSIQKFFDEAEDICALMKHGAYVNV